MTKESVINTVKRKGAELGSMRKAAAFYGVHAPELVTMLAGRSEPSRKLLTALGLERVVTYRAVKNGI